MKAGESPTNKGRQSGKGERVRGATYIERGAGGHNLADWMEEGKRLGVNTRWTGSFIQEVRLGL